MCDQAQCDTANLTRYEELLAEAYAFLGFEAEHIGGPGKTGFRVLLLARIQWTLPFLELFCNKVGERRRTDRS
jgi:hypothetical protein